jgi:beta-mannosidase
MNLISRKASSLALVFIVLALFLVSCAKKSEHITQIINLNQGWEFRKVGDTAWHPAQVPGTVHSDLLANKLIDDPYYRDNENKLQWISRETWEYRLKFDLKQKFLNWQNHTLKFEGLDTYAEVTLNGKKVLDADNMFRTWTLNSGKLLKEKENELKITFFPAIVQDSIKASKVNYKLPDIRGYSRKAPYQYGWDWGPRFVTCGIWRPVTLESWDVVKLDNYQIIQKDVYSEKANLVFAFDLLWPEKAEENDIPVTFQLIITKDNFTTIVNETTALKSGQQTVKIPVTINNPELWWCNGLGKPNLYEFELEIFSKNQNLVQTHGRFGIRTIELVRENDKTGQSFYFKLNGKPVFAKGANYIPQDNFIPRVTNERYEKTIKNAVAANMNMLRIWGGGTYESDLFYDLCDENGIMVWQDFMFACNMYPGDSAFLINVRHEAEDNIIRLRNHPSLALWCGNNEIDEGWHNWGWQKSLNYSKQDSTEVWESYQNIFHKILPETILELDPTRPYHPSSPTIGWGHEESRQNGDSHYWGVWWGEEPFGIYKERVGRFMSEYGFQGMPQMATIEKFTLPEDRKIGSPVMEVHQKHPKGMYLIDTYMKRDYPVPANFEDYVYASQLVQAEGIRTALEAHRRGMPHCMGTLYWQLNDCWPVTSWSSFDYYGNWKALHYFAREAYAKTILSPLLKNDSVFVYLISDKWRDFDADLKMKVIGFDGKLIWEESLSTKYKTGKGQVVFKSPVKTLLKNSDMKKVVFVAELTDKEGQSVLNLLYFDKPKNLELTVIEPVIKVVKNEKGYQISLTSNTLIKNICLEYTGIEGHLSQNFFDLLPNETKEVVFETKSSLPDSKLIPKIYSLNKIK